MGCRALGVWEGDQAPISAYHLLRQACLQLWGTACVCVQQSSLSDHTKCLGEWLPLGKEGAGEGSW